MTIAVPHGFKLAGVHCGLKRNPNKPDLSLIVADQPVTAAGVYTTNLVYAAPVVVDRERTPSDNIRVVVTNSGNANACTGERGLQDAYEMATLAGKACNVNAEQVLVMSTGIIGEHLKMDRIDTGITAASRQLADDEAAFLAAARGILTTDKGEKVATRTVTIAGESITITGMAKGAGMIGPKMATMLAVLMTDAALSPEDAQQVLRGAADDSFNCISVEGHMSTNDTALLLASGPQEKRLTGDALEEFAAALREVCIELARMIPADGEGATHLIAVNVEGAASRDDARTIAETIANSPLVKTAATGGDPNWGRIVSAAGYAGVKFDAAKVDLKVNDHVLYHQGAPAEFDAAVVSQSMRDNHETRLDLSVGNGPGRCQFWTSDLTVEYIRFNAEYHT